MPIALLHAYVFLTGAAVLALEIAASRLLAPHFGTSLFVWGNILGIVLGALALGYFYGGRLADRSPHPRTLGLLTWIAGVLVSIIPLLSPYALHGITEWFSGLPIHVIAASFFGMLALFALPLALLGAVTPLATRIAVHEVGEVGRVSGSLSAASTAGSLMGAFIPSFLLIPLMGTRTTILASAVVLILLGTLAVGRKRFLLGLFLPAALAWTAAPARSAASALFETESPYQHIRVLEDDNRLDLVVNEGAGVQTVSVDDEGLTGGYTDILSAAPALLPDDGPLDVLVIGVAGGSVIRQVRRHFPGRELRIDAVEIDPVMFEVADRFFGLGKEDAQRYVMDGRMYLESAERTYDIIVIDAYREEIYVPFHLTTREFFALASRRLAPEGIVVMNVLGDHDEGLLRYLSETARAVFPHVTVSHVTGTLNNVLVAGREEPRWDRLEAVPRALSAAAEAFRGRRDVNATDRLLTDDRAPVEFLTDLFLFRLVLGG